MSDIVERLRDRDTTRRTGESYADVHDRRQADRDEAADEITTLRAEVSELNSMFDAQWNADMAGVQMWREAHPGIDMVLPDRKGFTAWILADIVVQRAENEKLRAALEPFADMGKAMMGRKHPNEAVVQYALAPTIKVFHLVAAHEARAAITQEKREG